MFRVSLRRRLPATGGRAGFAVLVAGLVLLLSAVRPAFANGQPDLEAYGRLPQVEMVSLSPSGSVFAAVIRNGDGTLLSVFDGASAKPIDSLSLGSGKIRSLMWVDDERVVVIRSVTALVEGTLGPKGEQFMAFEYNFRKRKGRPLLMGGDRALNTVNGPVVRVQPASGPAKLILPGVNFPQGQGVLTLFEQGPTGAPRVLAQGRRDTMDWIVARDGTVLAEVRQFRSTGAWQVLVGRGLGQLKVVREGTHLTRVPSIRAVSGDGDSVYVSVPDEDDVKLFRVEVSSGEFSELPSDQGQAFIYEEGTYVTIGMTLSDGDELRHEWSDPRDQALWAAVQKAFGGARVQLVSMSSARDRLILLVEGKDYGFGYYLLDRKAGRASFLSDVYKGIGPEQTRPRRFLHYTSGDGLRIPAYLTLPSGRPERNLPLIVLPHGGPAARDDVGFDWWSQAYAAMGYAVLQPQFRGSFGFGPAHFQAGEGQVGGRMQTDLSDGVAELVRSGLVDPKRVAIVGASYGGYAALAGVTLQSGIYRCAVSVAGVSDWSQHLRDVALASGGTTRVRSVRYWRKLLDVADDKDPKLAGISPLAQAGRATAPILLVHGVDDTVVKIGHSERMAEALRKAGKPVELVTLKGEDHWLSNGETRTQMLAASARFLQTCNPATPS